jgi:hypothetical protein
LNQTSDQPTQEKTGHDREYECDDDRFARIYKAQFDDLKNDIETQRKNKQLNDSVITGCMSLRRIFCMPRKLTYLYSVRCSPGNSGYKFIWPLCLTIIFASVLLEHDCGEM